MGCGYIFKKGKNVGKECGVGKSSKCSRHMGKTVTGECDICFEDNVSCVPCVQCTFKCCTLCSKKLIESSCPGCRKESFVKKSHVRTEQECLELLEEEIRSMLGGIVENPNMSVREMLEMFNNRIVV